MSSRTEISNLALSNIGVGKPIANIDTEQSEAAEACRRWFEFSKEAVLEDLDWSFATEYAVLNLIEEQPTIGSFTEWQYSYRYPVGAVSIRRILSGTRNDTSETRIPFHIMKDSAGKLVRTDQQNAVVEYTDNVADPSFFSPSFNISLSFQLAYYISPRLTKGDPFKLQPRMLELYDLELKRAKKHNINEQVPELPPESELITTRN
jgi:hypothetical protein